MPNILVLNDEPQLREQIKLGLEHKGLRVYVAASVAEASEIVRELDLDLLVVDITLRDEADGLEFARSLRVQRHDLSVVVVTGHISEAAERCSQELGAIAYLEKPFDLSLLEYYVLRGLDQRELRRDVHCPSLQLPVWEDTCSAYRVLSELPVACIQSDGRILFTTADGLQALDSCMDPALPRPVLRVDDPFLKSVRDALREERHCGCAALLRRDGVVGHYTARVWRTRWGGSDAYAVLFGEAELSAPDGTDSLWHRILHRASAALHRPDAWRAAESIPRPLTP